MIYPAVYSFNSSVTHKPRHVSEALTLPGLGVGFPLWLNGRRKAPTLPARSAPAAERHFGAKPPPNGSYKLIVLCFNPLIHTNTETFFKFFIPVGLFSRSFRSMLVVTEATSVLCGWWWLLFSSRWPDVVWSTQISQTKLPLSALVLLRRLISWRLCAGSLGYEYAK